MDEDRPIVPMAEGRSLDQRLALMTIN